MKTLSLTRPLVLLLVGLPGSGKSFFARQFAEMFGAPLVSYDRLRFELFAKPQHSAEEHTLIQRIAEHQITELLKTKRSFVVDGGYPSRPERQALEQLAKAQGYDTLNIWVQTDPTTAKQRSLRRNGKQLDDRFSPSLNEVQFGLVSKRHTPPTKENYVVISGKHAFSTQAKMVLRKLSGPHVQEAAAVHEQGVQIPTRSVSPQPRPPAGPARRSLVIS